MPIEFEGTREDDCRGRQDDRV
ncbi:MAG: hypothetical protein RL215_2009, partial [Planctomycetota bacterium]